MGFLSVTRLTFAIAKQTENKVIIHDFITSIILVIVIIAHASLHRNCHIKSLMRLKTYKTSHKPSLFLWRFLILLAGIYSLKISSDTFL